MGYFVFWCGWGMRFFVNGFFWEMGSFVFGIVGEIGDRGGGWMANALTTATDQSVEAPFVGRQPAI